MFFSGVTSLVFPDNEYKSLVLEDNFKIRLILINSSDIICLINQSIYQIIEEKAILIKKFTNLVDLTSI